MVDEVSVDEDRVREIINDNELSVEEKRRELARLGVEDIDEVMNYFRLRPYILTLSHILGNPLDEFEADSDSNWNNYLAYLRRTAESKGYDPDEQISSISESTDEIVPYFRDSIVTGRPTYGLVVGDVQSGKTANFCGLIARACDLGVRIIIVMSGVTNILRHQTQMRIDDALGRIDGRAGNNWVFLTEQDSEEITGEGNKVLRSGDFRESSIQDPNNDLEILLGGSGTLVLVVKKRPPTLEKLLRWLETYPELLSRRQILFIDDESDSASINTQRNTPPDNVDLDIPQDEATRINSLIRSCIQVSEYSIYIGYTATPYAALLSDPWNHTRELGYSLYPRDFILSLPQPSEHNGTVEFFSDHGYLRSQVEVIPRADVNVVNALEPENITRSLEVSVVDFIITGAIKLLSSESFHHSMLIHCSRLRPNHERIERQVRRFGMIINREFPRLSWSGKRSKYYHAFKNRWEQAFDIDESMEEEMDDATRKFLRRFSWKSDVRSINSTEDDGDDSELYEIPNKLDYDAHEDTGLWVIAVGGTILSRGLTIEGLTISYFTREAALYDTLTQMARWYGYHGSNSHLIRVRISDQIHRWFRWIYEVESRIKEDIIRYEEMPDTNPLMLAPRVLRYAETEPLWWEDEPRDFKPTRRGAMLTAETRGAGYSGTYFSSRYLPLSNHELLLENQSTFSRIVNRIGALEEISGGYISREVEPETILDFIAGFNHASGRRSMNTTDIIDYIQRRNDAGELVDWSVAIMSPGRNRESILGTAIAELPPINVTGRGKNPGGSIDEIMDKIHVAADLENYPDAYRHLDNVRMVARQQRLPENGLLILYILDPEYVPPEGGSRGFVPLFTDEQQQTEVVAFGMALPDSEAARNEDDTEEYYHPRGIPGDV